MKEDVRRDRWVEERREEERLPRFIVIDLECERIFLFVFNVNDENCRVSSSVEANCAHSNILV